MDQQLRAVSSQADQQYRVVSSQVDQQYRAVSSQVDQRQHQRLSLNQQVLIKYSLKNMAMSS